ncbi:MAG: glutamine--fructose-6-phosphate transaminase (isomerizing) [Amoebophilaceae bacterium]|jgi:glucosamine--fructose-6-phosphate aminotransferase (isomerizing)|nr:glutamine--fructose-6-phosphate transaminase (isomerizing) [Amoebophilaceae bacterium]
MCGIIAYVGHQESYPILIRGLKRLEYRGYDSAGIALLDGGLKVYKKAGRVSELENAIANKNLRSHIGIGHTRWATHGAPSDVNAHPHVAASGKFAVVHNGIIENYRMLKKYLLNKGYFFESDTDTEVLAHFVEDVQQCNQCTLEEAVRLAMAKVVGAYALVVLSEDLPNTLIAARKGSPMVVGIGRDEFFIASDATPIVAYTDQVVFVNDHEVVFIQDDRLFMTNSENRPLIPAVQQLDITLETIEKGDFEHFMLKEIFEQPNAIRDCMRGRLSTDSQKLVLGGISDYMDQLTKAHKITIVACGTSWHVGLIAEYLVEEFCKIPVEVEYASEFRYRKPIIGAGDLVWAISQSGETADTLAAMTLAKKQGATILGICNVVESSIARMAHAGIYTHAGPEIGVASTKAFTAQLTAIVMMALAVARQRGTITTFMFNELLQHLTDVPETIEVVLQQYDQVKHMAQAYKDMSNFLFLGRGYNFPVALEGALKLKELSYIHAEGYPAAEMKHGPIALIDEAMPVVFIATQDRSYDKIIANIEEVKARKGKIIAIVTRGDKTATQLADHVIEVPPIHEALMPMIAVVPLQLLAYHMAVIRGCDVDRPRNLAKSVTVE